MAANPALAQVGAKCPLQMRLRLTSQQQSENDCWAPPVLSHPQLRQRHDEISWLDTVHARTVAC